MPSKINNTKETEGKLNFKSVFHQNIYYCIDWEDPPPISAAVNLLEKISQSLPSKSSTL